VEGRRGAHATTASEKCALRHVFYFDVSNGGCTEGGGGLGVQSTIQ